jgi:DNA-binding NarL/FixJ family response regulator
MAFAEGRPHADGGLTRRQLEVLENAPLGLTNAQVAANLGVTVHAVKFHLASSFKRLGVRNRTEAAVVFRARTDGREG